MVVCMIFCNFTDGKVQFYATYLCVCITIVFSSDVMIGQAIVRYHFWCLSYRSFGDNIHARTGVEGYYLSLYKIIDVVGTVSYSHCE
jgi:hypothetical protein